MGRSHKGVNGRVVFSNLCCCQIIGWIKIACVKCVVDVLHCFVVIVLDWFILLLCGIIRLIGPEAGSNVRSQKFPTHALSAIANWGVRQTMRLSKPHGLLYPPIGNCRKNATCAKHMFPSV